MANHTQTPPPSSSSPTVTLPPPPPPPPPSRATLLPGELLAQAAAAVSAPRDLAQAARVSRAWWAAATPRLWRTLRPRRASGLRGAVVQAALGGRPLAPRLRLAAAAAAAGGGGGAAGGVAAKGLLDYVRVVDLSGMNVPDAEVRDDDLVPLAGCVRLHTLVLRDCGNVTSAALDMVLANLQRLRVLDLSGATSLHLSRCAFVAAARGGGGGGDGLAALPPLESLRLRGFFHDPALSRAVAALWTGACRTSLRELEVEGPLTDAAFATLQPPAPSAYDGGGGGGGGGGGVPLRVLVLSVTPELTDATLQRLAPHCAAGLESLELVGCNGLSAAGLARFFRGGGAPASLRRVVLSGSHPAVDDAVLEALAGSVAAAAAAAAALPWLRELRCDACLLVSEVGLLAVVEACPRLELLSAMVCRAVAAAAVAERLAGTNVMFRFDSAA
ncbi:hypothetical protein HK405_014027 [Cladochytrium tenue]|nr:hypothetical protein HK405_014027 [Cladochytrium tenue]